jgi:signal transduction histidine kinase/ligand-binding sensor domain-containing protein
MAVDPHIHITQYVHTAWRLQDGAFEAAPNAIAQTADGYIWIGTGSGLVKYDGARFEAWSAPVGQSLPDSNIISLKGSSDGTLWIGTARGLASWKNNQLRQYLNYRIDGIIEDRQGRIWAAQARSSNHGGLCLVTGDRPQCFGADDQMKLPNAVTLTADTHGNLWVGNANQLLRWRDGSFEPYFREELAANKAPIGVESAAAAADGSVWVSVPSDKNLGLLQIVDGRPRRVVLEGVKKQEFTTLFIDHQGAVWLATADDGLHRFYNGQVDHFHSENGLSSNTVTGFFEDGEGNLWVATSKGLDFFRDNRVLSFSSTEGLSADYTGSVLAATDGTVWIGNRRTLDSIRDGKVSSTPVPGARVTALWQDHAGKLWVGIDGRLTIYERGRFTAINRTDGSSLGTVTAIGEDLEQNIWAIANPDRKVYRIHDLRVEEVEFKTPQIRVPRVVATNPAGGVWLGFTDGFGRYRDGTFQNLGKTPSISFMADADGSLWVSSRSGLVRWKDGREETLTSKNGLKCDTVFSSIRDDHKTLWLYTKCGLIGIPDSEVQRWWREPGSSLQTQVLDALDGATPSSSTFQPAVSKSPDGRLWFSNDSVVQMFDPNQVSQERRAPPVYVSEISADRKGYAIQGSLKLPPNPRDIEIQYTALSYSIPQRVRFRYKLEPRDQGWQDAGTRRQAFYSDLPPGQYRFHVIASNSDGVWNEAGATLAFAITPANYQTAWFRLCMIAAGLLSLGTIYRLRLHQVSREFNAHLEGQVDERLRVARELHDTLLQSFQGLIPVFQTARNLLPGRAEQATGILDEGLKDAAEAIVEGREAIQNLRAIPSMDRDLAALLTEAGHDLARTPKPDGNPPEIRVVVEGTQQPLAALLQDEVYRIGREMIRNAFRHADASRIEVEIRYDGGMFRLRVRDDGKGIDPRVIKEGARRGHWGVAGMRERAKKVGGQFTMWSEPGAGTEAELTVPGRIAYAKSLTTGGRWLRVGRRFARGTNT